MTLRPCVAIGLAWMIGMTGGIGRGEAAGLEEAKTLYASASYEEALAQLAAIEGSEDLEQVEQYRALCLLALGRTGDAERSLEQIVVRRPLFTLEVAEVSPKLVAMFHEVRAKVLPTVAKETYEKARANFDGKRFAVAATQFRDLIAILNDGDIVKQGTMFAELRQLGEGFMTLTEAALATAAPPPPAPAVVTKTAPIAPTPLAPPTRTIYTTLDDGIVPPVEIERSMPRWTPPRSLQGIAVSGALEIVVDERGNVDSASLVQPVWALYDAALLEETKRWRFRPATKDGQPVKYRKVIEIVLR